MNKQYADIDIMTDFHNITLPNCPIHLFGLKRESEGIYTYTYSAGSMFDEMESSSHPLPGTQLHEWFAEELLSKWTPQLEKAFLGEIQVTDIKVLNKYIRTTLYPVRGNDQDIREVVGTSSEMPHEDTIRKVQAQEMLKFKQLFDHALEAIVLCNSNFEIAEVNQTALEILNLPKEKLINRNIKHFFKKTGQCLLEKNWKEIAKGKKVSGEFRYRTSDGDIKEIEYRCEKDTVSGLYITLLKDVTVQKVTEQKLLKAETLNVVGELAAGVAHEIRNPLTSLKGFIQLIQNQTNEYDQYLKIILSEVDRIEHIIKEFLVLSRSNSQSFELTCIKDIVHDTVELLNTQAILKNVEIRTEYGEDLPKLYCDRMQLKQVFINFVKNAIEASSPGDYVEVKIKNAGNQYVQVQVCDHGCGMDEETISKIGKPFFTTKEEGTGLGMMVSNNIIKHHNGNLDVKSELGKGTEFHISLPVKAKP
jgi:two-component system, sporulation sensor kinase E